MKKQSILLSLLLIALIFIGSCNKPGIKHSGENSLPGESSDKSLGESVLESKDFGSPSSSDSQTLSEEESLGSMEKSSSYSALSTESLDESGIVKDSGGLSSKPSPTNSDSMPSLPSPTPEIKDPALLGVPHIVTTKYSTSDNVVADKVITPTGYGVDPAGIKDSTRGIQSAINDCYIRGGGTVFLPEGRYRITGQIIIKAFVTLRGDWKDPDAGSGYGTIILMDITSSDEKSTGTFVLGGSSGAMGLTIFYPHQSLGQVKPYPFTFYVPGTSMSNDYYMLQSIVNCTVINGYRGIGACVTTGVHEMMTVENFKGTFLETAAEAYNQADVGTWDRITISGKYWAEAQIPGYTPVSRESLDNYLKENSVGLILGDLEWGQFSHVKIENYATGIKIVKGKRIEFAGSFYNVEVTGSKIALLVENIDTRWGMLLARGKLEGSEYAVRNQSGGTIKLAGINLLGGLSGKKIEQDSISLSNLPVSGTRTIAKVPARFFNVVLDYGADPYGFEDSSDAIQEALDEAGAAGGGVVYVGPGKYRVNKALDVPANVELRGSSSVAVRDMSSLSLGTVLMAYYGRNPSNPQTHKALITLAGKNAGLRGIRIVFPENSPENYSVIPYAYTVRGIASGVYVVNSSIAAAYYGVDLQQADRAVVSRLVACCYENTVNVNKSNNVVIEFSLQNGTVITRNRLGFSDWLDEANIFTHLFNPITRKNAVLIKGSYSSDLLIRSCFAYAVKNLIYLENCMDTNIINVGGDNIGDRAPLLIVKSGKTMLVNALRYNGKSYESYDGARLTVINRLSIGVSGENNIK